MGQLKPADSPESVGTPSDCLQDDWKPLSRTKVYPPVSWSAFRSIYREVANTPGGIGYATASEVIGQQTILLLPLAKDATQGFVSPFTDTAVNKSAFADGSYPLTRRLFVILNLTRVNSRDSCFNDLRLSYPRTYKFSASVLSLWRTDSDFEQVQITRKSMFNRITLKILRTQGFRSIWLPVFWVKRHIFSFRGSVCFKYARQSHEGGGSAGEVSPADTPSELGIREVPVLLILSRTHR